MSPSGGWRCIYLDEAKYCEASEIFEDFILAPASEPEKQAFGHAGKVLLFNDQDKFEESQKEFLKMYDPSDGKPIGRRSGRRRDAEEGSSRRVNKTWPSCTKLLRNVEAIFELHA